MRRGVWVCLAAGFVLAVGTSSPAEAALSCGYKDKPKCVEAAPPGQTLTLTGADNPAGLQPLWPTSSSVPLYPRVRGHLPYGFNAQSDNSSTMTYAEEMQINQDIGGSTIRMPVDWSLVREQPGTWNYTRSDLQYREAIKRGIRPLLWLGRSPRRYTKWHNACSTVAPLSGCTLPTTLTGCRQGATNTEYCWNPPTTDTTASTTAARTGLDWWQDFVQDVATRYPLAAGIEVWNEPNHPAFWGDEYQSGAWTGDPPDAGAYTTMLSRADAGVAASGRDTPVVGGALANGGEGAVEIEPYLEQMLEGGAAEHMDALSFHPYPGPKQTDDILSARLAKDTDDISDAYTAAGVQLRQRLIASETGISLGQGYDQAGQALWVGRRFDSYDQPSASIPLSDRVDAVYFHSARDLVNEGFGWTDARDGTGAFPTRSVLCEVRQDYGGLTGSCPSHVP